MSCIRFDIIAQKVLKRQKKNLGRIMISRHQLCQFAHLKRRITYLHKSQAHCNIWGKLAPLVSEIQWMNNLLIMIACKAIMEIKHF